MIVDTSSDKLNIIYRPNTDLTFSIAVSSPAGVVGFSSLFSSFCCGATDAALEGAGVFFFCAKNDLH